MGNPQTLNILNVEKYGDITVEKYGIDNAYAEFGIVRDEYNEITDMMYSDVVSGETSEPRARFGSADTLDYVDLEMQFGRADASAVGFKWYEVGLPLSKGGLGTQWTKRYMQTETVERFNIQLNAAIRADSKWLRRKVGSALFGNTNFTYIDKYTDGTPLFVKRLLNADGLMIPVGPEGQTFDPTDSAGSHYRVYTAINDANMIAIENNLLEHVENGRVIHYINRAQEAAVRALTGFTKATDPRITLGITKDHINSEYQAQYEFNTNLNDRFVGIVDGHGEYYIKPWIPSGYIFSMLKDSPLAAPLTRRRDKVESSDMQVVTDTTTHPELEGRLVQRIVDFGVSERRNGVCTKIDAGNGAYTAPTNFNFS